MITPRFSCSQDDRSVVVSAYCPAVRASEIEIHVEDALLSLHVAPYFLRLNFPASVIEDDQSSAIYDPASGYLTLTLTKLNHGEVFPDLDLLGKLLAPPAQSAPRNPGIEVLDSQDNPGHTDTDEDPDAAERDEILKGEHTHTLRLVLFIFCYQSMPKIQPQPTGGRSPRPYQTPSQRWRHLFENLMGFSTHTRVTFFTWAAQETRSTNWVWTPRRSVPPSVGTVD